MLVFIIIVLFIITFAILKSIVRLIFAYSFLKKKEKEVKNLQKIKIIIPIMNEVNIVEKSVRYFMKLKDFCEVVYVTTSKEKDGKTFNKVRKLLEELKPSNINLLNCPNLEGTMATQLNYAAQFFSQDDIVGIYNVDSFPDERTFKYVCANIKYGVALQQVSYFDDKLHLINASAQNWQNRWSLIYEMGKYSQKHSILNFTYSIGHGFFIYKKDIEKYGYWSDKEINEDNELGYRILSKGGGIKPIPYMERAGFAKNTKIYIKQQSTWFNGPLYAFSYFSKGEKNIKNFILACFNFKAALSWLLFPYLIVLGFTLGFYCNFWYSVGIGALTFIYITVLNFLSYIVLKKKGYIKNRYSIFTVFTDFIFFIIHTFGPIITIVKCVCGKNNIKNKYNTEK